MPSTIENLKWRYATKRYDASRKLPSELLDIMMEALRLAPSSFGLQPYKFIHVTNPKLREELKAAAWNQTPFTDASDLFVLCTVKKMDEAYVDRFVAETAKAQGTTPEMLGAYKQMMMGAVTGLSEKDQESWNACQAYIALGVALATAAEHRIDATPMEGFDKDQFDEILGLSPLGLHARVSLALGYRSPEDKAQQYPKVRMAKGEIFIER
jgi:nitroreductase